MSGGAAAIRVVIAGGGTGGHVFPALAIKHAIVRCQPRAEVTFVGTRRGLEARILPAAGEQLELLWISGFSRRHMLRNLTLPLKLLCSVGKSVMLLRRLRPQVVIGTGGYVMGPVLWAAQILGIPTVLQEQNSYPGLTTRKLAPKAAAVCLGFAAAKAHLRTQRFEVTGNPVRADFGIADRTQSRAAWGLDRNYKTILVFGGSAGARSLNDAVSAALEELCRTANVIWQTGTSGTPSAITPGVIQQATANRRLVVREFITDMASAYAAADLAVCRAGALTLAELAVTGLPAILVPYPFAADDHQTANARAAVAAGGALLLPDNELTGARLLDLVRATLEPEDRLQKMGERMRSLSRPDAADRIAEIALREAAALE